MKAYIAIGTHHLITNFNVDGRMVAVDFNPLACIENERLQQSIENDTSYGILFESRIETVEDVTTSNEEKSTTGTDTPPAADTTITPPVTSPMVDTTTTDVPPAADTTITPVILPVITAETIIPSNAPAEDNKAAAIHGTVTTENMGSINANSVTKKISNKRNSKKQ